MVPGGVECSVVLRLLWEYDFNILDQELAEKIGKHLKLCASCAETHGGEDYPLDPVG